MRFIFLITIALTVIGAFHDGWAGLVAGLMLGLFVLFGIGGIIAGKGVTGGVGGVFAWFLLFICAYLGMFFIERFWIDGAVPGTYDPSHSNKVYFADKVLDVFVEWIRSFACLGSSSPGEYSKYIIVICFCFVLFGAIAKITK